MEGEKQSFIVLTYFSVGSIDSGFMENKFALTECVVRR